MDLELIEALTETRFHLKHFHGNVLCVQSRAGEIIEPNCVKVIKNAGLPIKGTEEKGHLYITFEIEVMILLIKIPFCPFFSFSLSSQGMKKITWSF